MKIKVTNIQRMCFHDGPGIRTTVFLKGCNLCCPWCSNPENIDFQIQDYGNNKKYGYEIELENLKKEILKDKQFFKNNGGVTFSGGECLLQFSELEPLLKELKKEGINICVETALTVPTELVDIAIKYVDEFYIDLKIIDETATRKINGQPELYIKNVKKVLSHNKIVVFRIPLVPAYTYTISNIEKIIQFLKENKANNVEIFKIHNLAEKKYKTLNKLMPKFETISEEKLNELKERIQNIGVNCKIIKI